MIGLRVGFSLWFGLSHAHRIHKCESKKEREREKERPTEESKKTGVWRRSMCVQRRRRLGTRGDTEGVREALESIYFRKPIRYIFARRSEEERRVGGVEWREREGKQIEEERGDAEGSGRSSGAGQVCVCVCVGGYETYK